MSSLQKLRVTNSVELAMAEIFKDSLGELLEMCQLAKNDNKVIELAKRELKASIYNAGESFAAGEPHGRHMEAYSVAYKLLQSAIQHSKQQEIYLVERHCFSVHETKKGQLDKVHTTPFLTLDSALKEVEELITTYKRRASRHENRSVEVDYTGVDTEVTYGVDLYGENERIIYKINIKKQVAV